MAQTNLLTDPGFEVSQGNYDASGGDVYGAVGWTAFNDGAYTTATIAYDGDQSFKTFGQYNGIYQQFTVTPGQSYTASVYGIDSSLDPMGTGTQGSLELNFYTTAAGANGDFNVIPVVVGGTSPMDTWIQASVTEVVPAGYNTMRIQLNQTSAAPSGSTYYDDASLVMNAGYSGPPLWSLNGSGDWNVAANWNGGVPNGIGATAAFLGNVNPEGMVTGTATSTTVFTDLPITVGTVHFSNPNTYEITGTGNLTLQVGAGSNALVQVDSGTQEFDLPVTVASNTTFSIASGANLLIANPLTVDAGVAITQSGAGTVTYQSLVNLGAGASLSISSPTIGTALNLASSAKVAIAASTGSQTVVQFNSLSMASGSKLDLANNQFVVNYAGGADPAASIASYLAAGYNGGKWNGAGLYSSTVASLNASQSKLIYAVGYADGADHTTSAPSGEILIEPTLAGDAKLQGDVVFGDFQVLAQYFGKAGGWDEGNFTYAPTIDFGDFQELAQDFGSGSSGVTAGELASLNSFAAQFGDTLVANPGGGFSMAVVPEPASLGLLAVAGVSLLSRRRQRGRNR